MIGQERLQNVEKWKTLVQGVQNEYCFPLLSMHIFSVVVDAVMVVAYAPQCPSISHRPVWLVF